MAVVATVEVGVMVEAVDVAVVGEVAVKTRVRLQLWCACARQRLSPVSLILYSIILSSVENNTLNGRGIEQTLIHVPVED
jgi:hypothetical protein